MAFQGATSFASINADNITLVKNGNEMSLKTGGTILQYATSDTTTFTPTKSDNECIVLVKGQWESSTSASTVESTNIDLEIDSVVQDSVEIDTHQTSGATTKEKHGFSLMYKVSDASVASHDVEVVTSSGVVARMRIIVFQL